MDPERALVAEAAAGNRDAFDELVRRHQLRIYKLARLLTGDADEAEDLVQETFVRAFRGMARFRGDSSFNTWLHRIAVNVVKSHASRRARKVPTVPLSDANEGSESFTARVQSNEDLESAIVRRQAIDVALASLPEELRLLVTLRDVQGLEYDEISSITGLPMGTVDSRLFRARQRLRPLLESLMGRQSSEKVVK